MTAMHLCGRSRIGFVALLLLLPLALQAQLGAKKILDRTAEAFRRAGGVEATFSLTGGQGAAQGTICLQGEKFRLESGGITTWFDGTTQWSYVAANEESERLGTHRRRAANAQSLYLVVHIPAGLLVENGPGAGRQRPTPWS